MPVSPESWPLHIQSNFLLWGQRSLYSGDHCDVATVTRLQQAQDRGPTPQHCPNRKSVSGGCFFPQHQVPVLWLASQQGTSPHLQIVLNSGVLWSLFILLLHRSFNYFVHFCCCLILDINLCVCVCIPLSERWLAAQEAQLLLQTTNPEGQIAGGQDQQEDAGRQTDNWPLAAGEDFSSADVWKCTEKWRCTID